MLFGEEKDWKELLEEESKTELADIIEKARKHRAAYMQADDVKVAQLWAALTEISKQIKNLECRLTKSECIAKAFAELAEIAKKEALREKMSDILKPKTSKDREIVDRLVDSLTEL
jgi:flagellar biosynthesis chaperone FliJ